MTTGSAAGPQLKDEDYEALAMFRHVLRRFLAFSESAAQEAGLTPQQHQALLVIRGSPNHSISVGELAEQLLVRHHSAVELADRLSHAELLRREADLADRRRVRLVLTPRAEGLLTELSATHREELRRLRPMLVKLLASLDEQASGS
ncbi:MAG TPA: MarR family transcriptional regulator [Roseomonas sp.]|nr:MarR family transcriptional regulator [Roseomonas sp.]